MSNYVYVYNNHLYLIILKECSRLCQANSSVRTSFGMVLEVSRNCVSGYASNNYTLIMHLPYTIQCSYVDRDWEKDRRNMGAQLTRLAAYPDPIWVRRKIFEDIHASIS